MSVTTSSGRCKSCGGPIEWAVTIKGRRMPLDPSPVLGGNVLLDGNRATVVAPDESRLGYVSHFATCPNAREHRRKEKA